jgi:hypothetical protein
MPSAVNSRSVKDRQMAIVRIAGQAGKGRIQGNYEYQKRCEGTNLTVGGTACHTRGDDWVGLGSTTQSPESTGTAGTGYFEWPFHLSQGQWTMPMTNKLLLEANMTIFRYNPAFGFPPPGWHHQPDSGDGAVHRSRCVGATGSMSNPGCAEAADPSTLQWAPRARLHLPRAGAVGVRGRRDQQLQRERVVLSPGRTTSRRLSVLLAPSAR